LPPAVAAAGIAAAATIGGAVMGSKAQKSAANQAAAAETQSAQINADLAREFRTENSANFAPNMQSGFKANALLDSFLYGPPPATPAAGTGTATPAPQPAQPAQPTQADLLARYNAALHDGIPGNARAMLPLLSQASHPQQAGPAPAALTPQQTQAAAQNGMDAYHTFEASPYYQLPLTEGMNALNNGYAARGMLESGDALKGITKYGQDYASGRMNEFLGLAENQTNRGVQAAGAIAGVSQNALNSITAANQSAADARANAALAKGAATSGMWSGIGAGIGTAAGSLFGGSSYGGVR
jgi:hypothetical protein